MASKRDAKKHYKNCTLDEDLCLKCYEYSLSMGNEYSIDRWTHLPCGRNSLSCECFYDFEDFE
jgi:hypothetical protein